MIEFNLFLPQMRLTFDQLVVRAQAAEAAGFVGMSGMDHLAPPMADDQPMYEAIVTTTWLAAHTRRMQLGSLVLCDAFRHPAMLARQAVELAGGILRDLHVVGLLTVEMFVTRDGRILVNELAPRTHNSGHLTIDGCVTSQFEQQVRAVCGLPLGSTELREPAAAMANLLGDLWQAGEPQWRAALEDPRMKLHLYGKAEPRPGRKMGHLNTTGGTAMDCVARVRQARERLATA